jgi:hypothetical protein
VCEQAVDEARTEIARLKKVCLSAGWLLLCARGLYCLTYVRRYRNWSRQPRQRKRGAWSRSCVRVPMTHVTWAECIICVRLSFWVCLSVVIIIFGWPFFVLVWMTQVDSVLCPCQLAEEAEAAHQRQVVHVVSSKATTAHAHRICQTDSSPTFADRTVPSGPHDSLSAQHVC